MYSHITPRVPLRNESNRYCRTTPAAVSRSLQRDLLDAELMSPKHSNTSVSPMKQNASSETARGLLGALAREYGDVSKCPLESIEIVCAVSGVTDMHLVEAMKQDIAVAHHQEEVQERAKLDSIRTKSPRSNEKKRALLERRLRYHMMLPAAPKQPEVHNQHSFVREYVRGMGTVRSQDRWLHKASSKPEKTAAFGGPSISTASSRSSSVARATGETSSASALMPSPPHAPRPSTAPNLKSMQLELLNLKRVLTELPGKLPLLQRIKQNKQIDVTTLDGQIQLFSEIFLLMDPTGSGVVDRESFSTFGKRIGGEAARIFSRRMVSIIRAVAGAATASMPLLSTSGSMGLVSPRRPRRQSMVQDTVAQSSSSAPGVVTKEMFLSVLFPGADSKLQSLKRMQETAAAAALAAEAHVQRWEESWERDDLKLLRAMFKGCDTNEDGLVCAIDILRFATRHQKEKVTDHQQDTALAMYQAQLGPFDRDGDGCVTLEEFAAMQRPVFEMQNKREEEKEQVFLFKDVKAIW